MNTIGNRELNRLAVRVLAEMCRDEPVSGTEYDAVARLRAAGHIIPAASDPDPWLDDEEVCYTPGDVDALYAEMREVR